jgi:predicted alpha-1,2-mannosidase
MRSSLAVAALALLFLAVAGCGAESDDETANTEPRDPTPTRADLFAAMDPRIGTGGVGFGVGSAYPGPAVPFAMIHPSPDTRTKGGAADFYHCAGYYASDPLIRAFSLVHFHGTGVPDYGTIGLMPTNGMTEAKIQPDGATRSFAKSDEIAEPGYYAVTLSDGIRVEITSTLRAAIFRFGFPDGADPVLLLDLDHRLSGETAASDVALDAAAGGFDAHVTHTGGMSGGAGGYDLFVRGALDVAPLSVGTFDDVAIHSGETSASSASGSRLGAYVQLPAGTRSATLRVAVSFVDAAGAEKNLEAEAPAFDFDGMRAAAEEAWRDVAGSVELWGASEYDTTVMATALYHAALMPTLASDVDGRHVSVAGDIENGTRARYTDFSLWDTYRTLHPWLFLTESASNADFAATLVDMAKEGGAVPRWAIAHGDSHTMVGSPGEIVLAEAALKGVPFDDEETAYDLARVAAYGPSPGPCGGRGAELDEYIARGYVPKEAGGGSVSKTQEFAVADAALARWAAKLGRTADAAELGARGKSFANLYDADVGFFHAKSQDGAFAPFGGPDAMSDEFVEGNAWHYLWMAPHDPDGLAEAFGGKDAALVKLRDFFAASKDDAPLLGVRTHYWPSNEPDLSAPWFFAAWGAPGETWRWVDWAVTTLYTTGVDGIPGNDDGGTMSAWLLFAGAGLYPMPGTDRYIVGAPRYPRMVLHRPSGDLVLECSRWPKPGRVPKRVTLDGVPLDGPTVSHAELQGAHVLHFDLERE